MLSEVVDRLSNRSCSRSMITDSPDWSRMSREDIEDLLCARVASLLKERGTEPGLTPERMGAVVAGQLRVALRDLARFNRYGELPEK